MQKTIPRKRLKFVRARAQRVLNAACNNLAKWLPLQLFVCASAAQFRANNKWAHEACVACDLCAALARSWHWIRSRCWRHAFANTHKYVCALKCVHSTMAMQDCQVQRRPAIIICAVVQTTSRQFCLTVSSFVCFLLCENFPINECIIVVEENLAVARFPLLHPHTDWLHNWHFGAINCGYVRTNFLPALLSGCTAFHLARSWYIKITIDDEYIWFLWSFLVRDLVTSYNCNLIFVCSAHWAAVGAAQLVRMHLRESTFIDGYIA